MRVMKEIPAHRAQQRQTSGMGRAVRRRFVGAVAGVATLMAASVAEADDRCFVLEQDIQSTNKAIVDLLLAYPGTNIVIGLCGATALSNYNSESDAAGAMVIFVGCASLGCYMAGFDNCTEVAKQWFGLAMRSKMVSDRQRAIGCVS